MMEPDAPVQDERAEDARPFAKVGDIVQYRGKWKDEIVFGEVRIPGRRRGYSAVGISILSSPCCQALA